MKQSKVLNPETLAEVLSFFEQCGDGARVIAGGQSLVPMISLGLSEPDFLINLSNCDDLFAIEKIKKTINIGAMVSVSEILNSSQIISVLPVLNLASKKVATPHVRNFGTLVGNVCHADPSSDLIPALLCLDAQIDLVSKDGKRSVLLDEFVTGPYSTIIRSGEVAVSVTCQVDKRSQLASYKKVARRAGDLGIATCAVSLDVRKDLIKSAKISVGGYLQKAVRVFDIEKNIVGLPVEEISTFIDGVEKIESIENTILPDGSLTNDYLSATFSRLIKSTLKDALSGK